MRKGICNLFQEERDLVKRSHIIPRFAFEESRETKEEAFKLLSYNPEKSTTSLIGPYSEYILSEDAETLFSGWETYAKKKLFLEKPIRKKLVDKKRTICWLEIESFNYEKLYLFLLSVIWRASISKNIAYNLVDLGERYDEMAREILLSGDIPSYTPFAFIFSKFVKTERHMLSKSFMSPYKTKINDRNGYMVFLAGYKIFCKVDRRPLTSEYRGFFMEESSPIRIFENEFEKSKDLSFMRRVVNRNS